MSDEMKTCLIEPLAPLVIRTGRPFDGQAGADAARFPPPSTLAGALRTAHAEASGKPLDRALAEIPVFGPLPVKLDENGKAALLVPKPADALYFWNADKSAARLVRAAPAPLAGGEGMDLSGEMLPVQLADAAVGKPASGPRWWAWEDFNAFRNGKTPELNDIQTRGWLLPEDDTRTHVAIERDSQAAENGKLFQTAGLSFVPRQQQGQFPEGRIGLIGGIAGEIRQGVITLGGERRLSAISPVSADLWPVMPANMQCVKGLCLTLLTPALFAAGWRPGWLDENLTGQPPGIPGLTLRLRAAALERWQPHSGWDLVQKKPRAGRKLVAAGATYWLEVVEASDDALKTLWLAHLSDHPQDRRDGFGLAIAHPWTPPNISR